MIETWILAAIIVAIVAGIGGLVMLALSRDMPDERMSERWRKENERDRGKS